MDMRSSPCLQSHTPLTAIQEIAALILAYAVLVEIAWSFLPPLLALIGSSQSGIGRLVTLRLGVARSHIPSNRPFPGRTQGKRCVTIFAEEPGLIEPYLSAIRN